MGGLLWNTAALSSESRQPPYGPAPVPLDGPELPSFRYPLGAQKTEQFNGGTLEPGTLDVIQVVIPDADAALAELRAKGVEAEGVDEQEWGRFVSLKDPDGNRWTLQELPDYSAAGQ